MNKMTEYQHYVSQVLLRRFKIRDHPLQRYRVQTDEWKPRSTEHLCAADGYNQFLAGGKAYNALEDAFSKVETHLPNVFEALEQAAGKSSTELPVHIFENLCWYCSFLKRSSPFAKAKAPADFVMQIDFELQHDNIDTLRDVLHLSKEAMESCKRERSLGR